MKNEKNAFTLIELLAIIVILAIIAVITVPIILNIIENSRKGAATDSAYGYKDSVNKYYLGKLAENSDYVMPNGTYTVNGANGYLTLDGSDPAVVLNVQVSGTVPSAGELHYTNNELKGGCLVIGEYKVVFTGSKVTSTVKGDCSTYVYVDSSNPTIASCLGCKFFYPTSSLTIGTDLIPSTATNDYTTLTSSHPYFLGVIENPNTKIIERGFACGIKNGTPFCLEGNDASERAYKANVGVLNTIFPSCNASASDSDAGCVESGVNGTAYAAGFVYVYGGGCGCDELNDSAKYCSER